MASVITAVKMLDCWRWHVLAAEGLFKYQQVSWFSFPFLVSESCSSLSLSLLKVQYCSHAVLCRKIWSYFCLNSSSNYGSFILPFLCLRWYVLLNFLSCYHIIQFKAKQSQFFHYMNRFRRSQFPPVLQPKQLQNEVYSWILCFHGPLNTTILQWVHSNSWLWPCPHWCKMGNCLSLSPSNQIFWPISSRGLTMNLMIFYLLAVQWHDQRAILIRTFCCWVLGDVLGCHTA